MLNQFNVSIWGDEAFSAILSMKSLPDILKIISHDTSPPLYNITEHIAFQLFGTSEIVIRGLSFFYYCIAIFFVYKIASFLWGKKTGILAALFSFFNPFFFIYAFEGRMYSILALGVVASMYFFLRRNWKAYIVATLFALYSHHFAFFALFVQGFWFLYELIKPAHGAAKIKKRKLIRQMFLSFIAVGILYLPWLPFLYAQTKMVGSGFWLGRPTLLDLRRLIYDYLATGISNKLSDYALILVILGLVLRKWRQNLKQSLFVLSWFLIPILLAFGISQKFSSIFYNRYLLYSIPASMILLSSNTRKIHIILLGAIIAMFLVIDFNYFTHPTKLPFREFSDYVKEVKHGDDYLINWNGTAHHLWESKYYGIPAPIYNPGGALPYFVGTALMEKVDIVNQLPKKRYIRIGVITSGPVEEVKLPGYNESEVKNFGDLKLIWFTK
ncbi:MAG: glycosyltransferase family 39 protein [Candidatus Woesebacteria bacterium]|nr:MAG: glycosyltransferase family 39 protein [Candidatus Woesebacteria bacterium]